LRADDESSFYSEDFSDDTDHTPSKYTMFNIPNSSRKSSARSKKKVNYQTSDEEFKKGYSSNVLEKQSTLVLKTSFHLINYILMGMC